VRQHHRQALPLEPGFIPRRQPDRLAQFVRGCRFPCAQNAARAREGGILAAQHVFGRLVGIQDRAFAVGQEHAMAQRIQRLGQLRARDGMHIQHVADGYRTPQMGQQQFDGGDFPVRHEAMAVVAGEHQFGEPRGRAHQGLVQDVDDAGRL
jgi:hypothetical protein